MDSRSRLPHLKVNNAPVATPSREGITSMSLASGNLGSDIQVVRLRSSFDVSGERARFASFLKPVCCLKRAEFQLQLQISLKGKAFMLKSSDRAARCQLHLSHTKRRQVHIFLFLIKSSTVASSYLVFLLSVCSCPPPLRSPCFFVFFCSRSLFCETNVHE